MSAAQRNADINTIEILSEDVPVTMPELPLSLMVTTPQQFKALGDSTRDRILAIIQYQPATAKQIADRLKVPPGTIGHHLQVLEEAGLVKIVARRLVRGVVAKYYTRAARIFCYDLAREVTGSNAAIVHMLTQVRDELLDALTTYKDDPVRNISAPRARLSDERIKIYRDRLMALLDDFLNEPPDPHGEIYTFSVALFKAPAYVQSSDTALLAKSSLSEEETHGTSSGE
jgi:DNA-binding transcriptional ArsR family regulator